MSVFWRYCPLDQHTCALRNCLAHHDDGCPMTPDAPSSTLAPDQSNQPGDVSDGYAETWP